jgi:hypothetical protein
MSIQVLTFWRNKPPVTTPTTDEERHVAFTEFAVNQVKASMPWLLPLLDEANATIYAGPRLFLFRTPNHPEWVEVPQISECIAMVPWAEVNETPQ